MIKEEHTETKVKMGVRRRFKEGEYEEVEVSSPTRGRRDLTLKGSKGRTIAKIKRRIKK